MFELGNGVAVVAVQAVLRANPEVALAVLQQGQPGILGEAVIDGQMLEAQVRARGECHVRLAGGGGLEGGEQQEQGEKE